MTVPALDFDLQPLQGLIAEGFGGVLLLGSMPAPSTLGSQLRSVEQGAPGGLAPLVMADEEGGGVQRLAGLVTATPWAQQMAQTMTAGEVGTLAARVGLQMKAAGVAVDLAPVLDVDGGQGPSAIDADGLRAFSNVSATVTSYGVAYLKGLERSGVIPVVKHFPGLGNASGNTDNGPASTQPLAALQTSGLLPFEAAIRAGAPAVMVSNAVVPGLSTLPASVSPAVIDGLLRGRLHFDGLVVTDSLSAGAITQAGYTLARAAVAAIGAGADIVLFGSTLTQAQTDLLSPANVAATADQLARAIVAATTSGALAVDRLDQAVTHLLAVRGVSLCKQSGRL